MSIKEMNPSLWDISHGGESWWGTTDTRVEIMHKLW